MKLLVVFLSVFLVVISATTEKRFLRQRLIREPPVPERKSTKAVQELWITQQLDHFDDQNTNTWEMRYYANDEHYQSGGPLFIYVGGEWDITPGWVQGGHMYDMAREMNGYVFYTEHRYYGLSIPVPDVTTENLKYLHVDQALADLAHFVTVMKATLPGAATSGVVMVGASYSATMVTWFRQHYPQYANGVWSSSAPLLAKKDFVEYMEVVGWAMGHVGGQTCYDRLEEAFAQMEAYVASGDTSRLQSLFNICSDFDFNNQLDVWSLFSSLSSYLSGVVQYAWPGDIEGVCASLTDASYPDALDAFANWVMGGSSWCFDASHQSWVDYLSDTYWGSSGTESAWRQWLFQTCNEYGWYQTSGSNDQPFGSSFPVELQVQWCADVYDNTFNAVNIEQKIVNTNLRNNGLSPIITNAFSTHGELDPWRPMGVQTDVNPSSPVVILTGYAHCADLYSISASDTEQMRETKERVTASVREWLGL